MAVILICTPIYAHPAEKIELKWDEAASVLDVSIVRPVKNTANHYMARSWYLSMEKEIEEKDPKIYKATPRQNISYLRSKDLKKGSKIEVEATCNVFGKLKDSMVL